jgi:hypothetical protein
MFGYTDIVRLLLTDPEIDVNREVGSTPLATAVAEGHEDWI